MWKLHTWMQRNPILWHAWKVLLAFAVCGAVMAVYFPVMDLTMHRSRDLGMSIDQSIPFIPWTFWIYFPFYLAGLLFAVMMIRDVRIFNRALISIALVTLLSTVVYLIIPSNYPRPLEWEGEGVTADVIYWFWTIDRPNNTFPSTHVANATIAALAMWLDRNPGRFVNYISATGVVITIHTTKQHYIIDAVGGLFMAFVCFWLVAIWIPGWRGEDKRSYPRYARAPGPE
jgi:membrane-associated phospholipid phosphatase